MMPVMCATWYKVEPVLSYNDVPIVVDVQNMQCSLRDYWVLKRNSWPFGWLTRGYQKAHPASTARSAGDGAVFVGKLFTTAKFIEGFVGEWEPSQMLKVCRNVGRKDLDAFVL